ncbi:hypothetical protein WICPIJ_008953 [Wickerhamomyces pijperi]|uniref:Uncharacterized protein n=1 Tax=Wickerhamomyces pijperi TaxID=599730 RepID=A0A9P8PSH4_WICPI|nr:hypothetical protein WICPIJ_008953 [Wickerhamomyces pijperi]
MATYTDSFKPHIPTLESYVNPQFLHDEHSGCLSVPLLLNLFFSKLATPSGNISAKSSSLTLEQRQSLLNEFETVKEYLIEQNPAWPHEVQVVQSVEKSVPFKRNRLFVYHWIYFWRLEEINMREMNMMIKEDSLDPFVFLQLIKNEVQEGEKIVQPQAIKLFCVKNILNFLQFHTSLRKGEIKLREDTKTSRDLFKLQNFKVEISKERLIRVWNYHRKFHDENFKAKASAAPSYLEVERAKKRVFEDDVDDDMPLRKKQQSHSQPLQPEPQPNSNAIIETPVADTTKEAPSQITNPRTNDDDTPSQPNNQTESNEPSNDKEATAATAITQPTVSSSAPQEPQPIQPPPPPARRVRQPVRQRVTQILPPSEVFTSQQSYKLSDLPPLLSRTRFISSESLINTMLSDQFKGKTTERSYRYLWDSLSFDPYVTGKGKHSNNSDNNSNGKIKNKYDVGKVSKEDIGLFWNGLVHQGKYVGLDK